MNDDAAARREVILGQLRAIINQRYENAVGAAVDKFFATEDAAALAFAILKAGRARDSAIEVVSKG